MGKITGMEEEPELINSALERQITQDGLTVSIYIYRGETDDSWLLEVGDHLGGSTVWGDRFPTEQAALDEALQAIDEDGIESFTVKESTPSFVDPQLGLLADPLDDGSAAWAFTCTTPNCDCRHVVVVTAPSRDELLERAGPFADAWSRGEAFRDKANQLEGVTSFSVDIDSGALLEVDDTVAPDVQRAWDQLSGVHLDEFAELWHLGKGVEVPLSPLESTEPIHIEGLEAGERVLWDEVDEPLRSDYYVDADGGAYAHEYYCPAPRCDCDEVMVDFADSASDNLDSIGVVSFNFTSGETVLEPSRPALRQRLGELWRAFCQRYPNKEQRFRKRRRDLAAAFDRIVGLREKPVTSAKVPRNAICPCGSGKKYKKCCGRN